ncbi:MAG TPA: patatin-like phospholipase family protein [Thermoanaerobaculia bacterium]|nr:patatin-like phospholipase family protein [Thermoanaerobaculia bacterium]
MTYGQDFAAPAPPIATRRPRQHAVVFSGNGYNAAYEVGVLKAILHGVSPSTRGEKIEPKIYTGTSVGAYNAAFMVSCSEPNEIAAAEKLEQAWTVGVGPRFRANPFDYLNPRYYWPNPLAPLLDFSKDAAYVSRDLMRRFGDFFASFDPAQPLGSVQKQILDYEWDILADIAPMSSLIRDHIALANIRWSRKELRVTAANWKRGTTKTFANQDFTDEAGHTVITAAMAIPGAVPRQVIDLEEFVDGAMLMPQPLKPAIDAGSKSKNRLALHVIYLDPEFGEGPLMDVRGSFSVVYRLFLLAFSRSVNADIERIDRTNRALKFLELLRDFDPESEVMKLWSRLNQETVGAVEVEVHRYRSAKHLASLNDLFLQVSTEKLQHLIENGYADARRHNCEEAGCVLISEEEK